MIISTDVSVSVFVSLVSPSTVTVLTADEAPGVHTFMFEV